MIRLYTVLQLGKKNRRKAVGRKPVIGAKAGSLGSEIMGVVLSRAHSLSIH